jgi:lysophospholipase L1-like esterase
MNHTVRKMSLRHTSRLLVESLEARQLLAVDFDYAMAERFGRDLNNNGLIDLPNTATYAEPAALTLTFSVLDDPNPAPSTVYAWTMQPGVGASTVVARTAAEIAAGNLPTVSVPGVTYATTFQKVVGGVVVNSIERSVSVRDILIVSLGDSYSSGEGNPERVQGLSLPFYFPSDTIPYLQHSDLNQTLPAVAFTAVAGFLTQKSTALWADGADGYYGPTPFGLNMTNDNRQSHRSTVAATAQYALDLERSDPHTSVTFVHVSQSGATTQTAIGAVPAFGQEDPTYRLTAQTKLIQAIVGTRPIDQLFVSLGGNDVGFTTLAQGLVVSNIDLTDVLGNATSFAPNAVKRVLKKADAVIAASTPLNLVLDLFKALAAGLPTDYASVQAALNASGVVSRTTFITEYPDPLLINRTFVNPNNGRTFTLPWWGPAVFDVLPPGQISATESYFVSKSILAPLNQDVAAAAKANGWVYLSNISTAFLGHGYDAPKVQDSLGNLRFVRTAREASLFEGPVGLTGPISTRGTLHPNALGHQAIKAAIEGDLTPNANVAVTMRGGKAIARLQGRVNQVRNAGLTYAWDFDRLPGQGVFRADATGSNVALTGKDPDRKPGRVATLRITNAFGLTTERAVFLSARRS